MGDYRDDAKGYVSFVMLKRRGTHSFAEYNDKKTGKTQRIVQKYDRYGNPISRRFKWTSNQPVFNVPITQTEVIEFIRNYPLTWGSKNAANPDAPKSNYAIAEINEEADARLALDAGRALIKAQELAYALEEYPSKLARIARMVGEDSSKPAIQVYACVTYAKSNAKKFIEMVEDEYGEAKDLVEQALDAKIIKKQGFMYKMGKFYVGSNNIDDVIMKVSSDPELFESLKIRLSGESEVHEEEETDKEPSPAEREGEGRAKATN